MAENLKFEIELESMYTRSGEYSAKTGPERLYRVKGFNTLVFDEGGIKKLRELNKDNLETVSKEALLIQYNKGYDAGFEAGKRKALEDLVEYFTAKPESVTESCSCGGEEGPHCCKNNKKLTKEEIQQRKDIFKHFYGDMFAGIPFSWLFE